jgi:hypothetical protein
MQKALIPILTVASADHATRSKWLERLFEAVQNDGVEYLAPLEDRWGEIAQYPDLIDEYADRMIGMVRRAWADHQTFQHLIGTSVCLSCLLEGGRYDELHELLATRRMKSWSSHRFGAEALWFPRDYGKRRSRLQKRHAAAQIPVSLKCPSTGFVRSY